MAKKRLSDFEMRQIEMQARRDTAWGAFSTHARAVNYERETERLDAAVSDARTPAQRNEAQNEKDRFGKKTRRGGVLVVGGT